MTRLRVSMLLSLILVGATTALAAPAISVDNPMYEVSIQAAGTVVHHIFTVTNTGNQILNITDVRPSCLCTTATPTKAEVAPGKSVAISVAVDTAGFAGIVARTVTLESNDLANPALLLVVSVTSGGESHAKVPTISVSDFHKRFSMLVDVRTPEEFASGHLLGAINIPLSDLQENLQTWIPRLPKDVPIVLQCSSGVRSVQAAQILLWAGFTNVLSFEGGITEWTKTFGSGYLSSW